MSIEMHTETTKSTQTSEEDSKSGQLSFENYESEHHQYKLKSPQNIKDTSDVETEFICNNIQYGNFGCHFWISKCSTKIIKKGFQVFLTKLTYY